MFNCVLLLAAVYAQQKYCRGEDFCAYGMPDPSGLYMIFNVFSSAPGWAAIGIGSSMYDAETITGWKNSTNGYSITLGRTNGHVAPIVDSFPQAIGRVPITVPIPAWAKTSFAFVRPLNSHQAILKDNETDFIFAYSQVPPKRPDDPTSPYGKHSGFGVFKMNYFKPLARSSAVASSAGELLSFALLIFLC